MALNFKSNNTTPGYQPVNFNNIPIIGKPIGIPQVRGVIPIQKQQELPPLEPPGAGLNHAINYYADMAGCSLWRMMMAELLLNTSQRAVISGGTKMVLDPRFYAGVKSVRLQRQATNTQLNFFKFLKEGSEKLKFRIIYEVDDIIFKDDIPDYNRCKEAFDNQEIFECSREMIRMSDEVTVTCDFMKNYYIEKTGNKNVTVLPNYPSRLWMDRYYDLSRLEKNYDKYKKQPRIVCAISGTHIDVANKTNQRDDYYHVIDDIIRARKDFKFVWVGAHPLKCIPFIKSGEMEFVSWFPLLEMGKAYTSTDANVAIAALEDNTFNRAKSNIKLLEPACCGVPAVLQDMITYKDALLKFNNGKDLIDQLKFVTKDKDTYLKYCIKSREIADRNWLEDHLDEYFAIYFTAYGSKERNKIAPILIKNNMDQKNE